MYAFVVKTHEVAMFLFVHFSIIFGKSCCCLSLFPCLAFGREFIHRNKHLPVQSQQGKQQKVKICSNLTIETLEQRY